MKATKKSGSSANYPHLPAMQPLTVEVEEVEYKESTYNGKKTPKAYVRMKVIEGPYAGDGTDANPGGKVWGNHAMTFGKRKNGEVSKLRQLVTAARPDLIAGKSDEEAEAILYDFDLDEMKPRNGQPGARLIVVGNYAPDDEEQQYLSPLGYSSLPTGGSMNRVTAPAATIAPAPFHVEDGYTMSPDGSLRWKPGMAGWEPVPQAAAPATAPPPLPSAPAGPPPLPTGDKAKVTF